MAQQRQIDAIAQRADHYETDAGRELRQRAAARIRALQDRDPITDGGTVADSGRETTAESVLIVIPLETDIERVCPRFTAEGEEDQRRAEEFDVLDEVRHLGW